MTDFQQFPVTVILRGVIIPFVAALVSTGTVFWLFSLPMRRLAPTAHWSETARLYWPLRVGRTMATVWIVVVAGVSISGEMSARGGFWMMVPVVIATIAGCNVGYREALRGLNLPGLLRSGNFKSTFAYFLLYPALPAMLAIMALTWQRGLGLESLAVTGGVLLVLFGLCLGGSVFILRITGLLCPVDEPLQKSSRELAAAQGVPLRHVLRMDLPMANAFAFPWTKDLGFTRATLDMLDPDELASVIGHELGHLKEGMLARWTRLAGLFSISIVSLAPAAIRDDHPLVALACFAVFILLSRFTARFHKRLEIAADQEACLSESEDGVYARALEKIHAASLIPAVLHSRSHYPSLYDRMASAGITPDFPRLKPPGRLAPMACGAAATALFFLLWQGLGQVAPAPSPAPPSAGQRA